MDTWSGSKLRISRINFILRKRGGGDRKINNDRIYCMAKRLNTPSRGLLFVFCIVCLIKYKKKKKVIDFYIFWGRGGREIFKNLQRGRRIKQVWESLYQTENNRNATSARRVFVLNWHILGSEPFEIGLAGLSRLSVSIYFPFSFGVR